MTIVQRVISDVNVAGLVHMQSGALVGQMTREGMAAERPTPVGVLSLPFALLFTTRGDYDGQPAIASDITTLPEFVWRTSLGRWTPRGGRQMLSQLASTNLVNPATATPFFQTTIPANLLFAGMAIEIDYVLAYPNNANTKTFSFRIGNTVLSSFSRTTSANDAGVVRFVCTSDTAQEGYQIPGGSLAAPNGTASVNTPAGTTVGVFAVAAADTVTLSQARVWLMG